MATQAPQAPTWTLGDRLVKARNVAGLKQAEMAARLGIGRRSITRYEEGVAIPKRAIILAWSSVTGVPLWWLDGSEPPEDTVTHRELFPWPYSSRAA